MTSATISPLAVSFRSSVPCAHVTVRPDCLHWTVTGLVPCPETKDVPASRVPVSAVLVEAAGPLFLTDQS